MRWLWATDAATLELFEAAAKACIPALQEAAGSQLLLYSACFVVVRGGNLSNEEASRHVDWGHRRFSEGETFTCLSPLQAFPSSVGGLHFWPWDSRNAYGRITSMNMNTPFLTYVHKYADGCFAAVDGKLFHRTEPFTYQRAEGTEAERAACSSYEKSGCLRVLISLSIASTEARLARYVHKLLKGMTPKAAIIRDSPSVFLDSESECETSDSDSDCDEVLGPQSLKSVLQRGSWRGYWRPESNTDHYWTTGSELQLDLAFDFRHSVVVRAGKTAGHFKLIDGAWHVTVLLERGQEQGNVALAGKLVRGAASVFIQGCLEGPRGRAHFCIFPPRPWQVLRARWKQFPLPLDSLGVPPEPGVSSLQIQQFSSITNETVAEATDSELPASASNRIIGRWAISVSPARSSVCGDVGTKTDSRHDTFYGSDEVKDEQLDVYSPVVWVSEKCSVKELELLPSSCVIVAPEGVQRHGTFHRLLETARNKHCPAILIMQGERSSKLHLLRKVRLKDTTVRTVSVSNGGTCSGEASESGYASSQVPCVTSSAESMTGSAPWAPPICMVSESELKKVLPAAAAGGHPQAHESHEQQRDKDMNLPKRMPVIRMLVTHERVSLAGVGASNRCWELLETLQCAGNA
eukprot:TRINITY_DN5535_c1_g2_i1.p1 TRINITY_DN5535_c1_g2~~TRINITY_DN5535_c1_g2_i1.p1  ORF type:complete len:634 (-),score=87.69 TRINITY_DN5535_c1_g2_i1:86-1987(-)